MFRGTSSTRAVFIILTYIQGTGAAHAARSFHDATSSLPSVTSPYARSEAFTDPKRKQTIISLLDVLSELSSEASSDNGQSSPTGHHTLLIIYF
jgi:hypothetical protein